MCAVLLCPSIVIDQQITSQPVQPHRKRTFARSKTLQCPKYPQEDFLRQILRLAICSGKAVTDRIHPPCMHANQFFPSGFAATEALLNQWEIGIQSASDLTGVLCAKVPCANPDAGRLELPRLQTFRSPSEAFATGSSLLLLLIARTRKLRRKFTVSAVSALS